MAESFTTRSVLSSLAIFASACAVARHEIPPIVEDVVQLVGGTVKVAEYALNGSIKLAQNAVTALGENNAVLLANHGVVGCGTNLNEAKVACELVEKAAQIYIYANQLPGGAKVLADDDVAIMHDYYLKYYRQS